MKMFLLSILSGILLLPQAWLTNIEDAKQIAHQHHKYILLNFSGSDWCAPCIRMHKDIFDSKAFIFYADSNLVLLNADFPRLKKNRLSAVQQKANDALADVYNPTGIFPYTLLLDADGKVLKSWEKYYANGTESFIKEIKGASLSH
ncbi:thioredoxin family protein [Ferruginibacter albus]|uniref:thioredoxin family protein n=1 Tax=Ferruginibacter albus TaxID=2875540 RepID=UPI001CC6A7C5|nr:thioredoxin family protein [Ferruginibacter albus]UAY50992.1 thioredoxin family protein [Ferruginibacter albus]